MAQYTFDSILVFNVANCVLPSGYTKQLSLISDGNQYILLPSTNGNPSGVCISFRVLTPYGGDKSIYGQIGNNAPYLGQNSNTIGFAYKSGTAFSSQVAVDSNRHVANINYNADKKITLDGNLLFTATAYYANNKPLAIFNAYYNNGVHTGQPCEIYYAESTINDTNGNVLSKMTLIPASNGSDFGMYDIENDIYYTNNGTGTFTSGGTAPTYTFQNGDTCTITELGLTMTYNDGYFRIVDNQTLTLSQATQLFSFAKGDNGVTVTVTSTGGVYKYEGDDWQLWYTIIPPLVFKGVTFEQTDYWQKPEMVFRGISFEGENILRYYGVKIDVNGETERNYIPCIRTSDGIAGVYDTVNGVFYASVGTTNFIT